MKLKVNKLDVLFFAGLGLAFFSGLIKFYFGSITILLSDFLMLSFLFLWLCVDKSDKPIPYIFLSLIIIFIFEILSNIKRTKCNKGYYNINNRI